ncbi:MAG: hypothetical protein H6840_09460 [Planctomycetes bacterium]|nr:hypothetical protein [Planctomycetota bacterium]
MPRWQLAESSLVKLAEAMPAFDLQACLVKTVAVNSIFGTQVLATMRMAEWVHKLLGNGRRQEHGIELVETMAALRPNEGDKPRVFTSFAAKFCHFFVDADRYPIYDDAARQALKLHLGKDYREDPKHPYTSFCRNFETLRGMAEVTAKTRDLDRYLWLTGMYMRWQKERRNNSKLRVNEELLNLLNAPSTEFAALLDAMLPTTLPRDFKEVR